MTHQSAENWMKVVAAELDWAMRHHGPMNSGHEAYAVILEELDEMWEEVKTNRHEAMIGEVVQVAAMALRLLADLGTDRDLIFSHKVVVQVNGHGDVVKAER